MTNFKLVTWNIEWMNNLFTDNRPKEDDDSKTRFDQISNAIKDLDPHILSIQEGPNDYEEMTAFINTYLSGNYECIRAPMRDHDPVTGKAYSDTQLIWIKMLETFVFSISRAASITVFCIEREIILTVIKSFTDNGFSDSSKPLITKHF